jgi:predicted O-methyltransferase YrrM
MSSPREAELRASALRGDDAARGALDALRARLSLESIGLEMTGLGMPSDGAAFLMERALASGDARVLEVGSSRGERAEALLRQAAGRPLTLISVDGWAASAEQALQRLSAFSPPAGAALEVHLYFARFGGAAAAPHFTRIPALVELLRRCELDLILLDASREQDELYLDLVQMMPLLSRDAILVCESPSDFDAALAVAGRLTDEFGGEAVVCRSAHPGSSRVLFRAHCQTHSHEQTSSLVDALLRDEPDLARARAAGDHESAVGLLRSWLARRLTWSTQDLLLPLGALPPPLNVEDVVERCAIGHGGVWSYGAAVTLAMLYRAFGYAATVYQFGFSGAFTHMVTLVGVPDGRILVQDAFLDAEPRGGGRLLTWQELIGLAVARRLEGIRYGAGRPWSRAHLYSRRGLAESLEQGRIDASEARRLEEHMARAERVRAEPRGALQQAWSTSLEGLASVRRNASALRAIASEIGTAHPLALAAYPVGGQVPFGVAAFDRQIEALYAGATSDARAMRAGA